MRNKVVKLALFDMVYFFSEDSMDFLFALNKESDFSKRRFFSINETKYEVASKKPYYRFTPRGLTLRADLLSVAARLLTYNTDNSLVKISLNFKKLENLKPPVTLSDFKFELMKGIFARIKSFDSKLGPFDSFLLSTSNEDLKDLVSANFGSRSKDNTKESFLFIRKNEPNLSSSFNILKDSQGQLAVMVFD